MNRFLWIIIGWFAVLTSAHAEKSFEPGVQALQKKRYAEAVKYFKNAVAQEPNASIAWYFLGESLAKVGSRDESICAFFKVLDLPQPDSTDRNQAHLAAARIQEIRKNYQPSSPLNCRRILAEIVQKSVGDSRPLQDRLKSCDQEVAISAAEEILGNPDSQKEPLELFLPAAALFRHGKKDDAVFWFYAAQLRARYQLVFERGDRGQLLAAMMMTIGIPINNYAFQDVEKLGRILEQVLEWDKRTPNPFNNKPKTPDTDRAIEQIYSGFHKLEQKIIAEKADLESKARAAAPMIEQTYSKQASSLCSKGQIDPADANQVIEKEWLLVIEFVERNTDVIREVGPIKGVGRESYIRKSGEIVPSRYIASVGGDRSVYAVIDVSRSGEVAFSLACLTHRSLGQRDPFKDICKQ